MAALQLESVLKVYGEAVATAQAPGGVEVVAERVEVVVAFEKAGSFALKTLSYDRGWMGPGRPDDRDLTLMSVEARGPALTFGRDAFAWEDRRRHNGGQVKSLYKWPA